MKKVLALLLCGVLMVGSLAGCGKKDDTTTDAGNTTVDEGNTGNEDEGADTGLDMSETVKIGILLADSTTAESLAFQNYYKNYIGENYNVELIYSDELADAAAETSAIDNFIASGCKAVISFSDFDRMAQLDQCSAAGVYFAVATGTLSEENYEIAKTNEYYVGAIGPSLEVEFQTGYDMAKYYLDQGKTKFAIFGGALPYYTDMHIYRAAGMLLAMVEAGGEGANYLGATTKEDIIGTIYGTATVETGVIGGDVELVGYVGGYDMTDAWFGKCAEMCAADGLEVILAVGNGSDFFAANIAGTDIQIGSVDAYAEAYGTAMADGGLHYLAGKFSASIAPIFIATYRAALGAPLRNEEGNAFAIGQGYWIATSSEQFQEYYAVDGSVEAPAYTTDMLDQLFTCDYAAFEEFVGQYSFDEIKALQQ